MARPVCPGEITTDTNGVPYCEDGNGQPAAWEAIPEFSIEDIDPVVAGEFFAAGFVIVGTCWVIGFSARAILRVVRR